MDPHTIHTQCCDMTKRRNKWGRSRNFSYISELCGRTSVSTCSDLCLLQPLWTRNSEINRLHWRFLACHRHGRFLWLHFSPWMIRSRLSTMDELPNSAAPTRMERCSDVPLRPCRGLFMVFAEGVTLKNCARATGPHCCVRCSLISCWSLKPTPTHF